MAQILPSFDELEVTTITSVVKLKGSINLGPAFVFLPIYRTTVETPKRQVKKIKLPYLNVPGAILTAKYKDATRGLIRTNNPNKWMYSIIIDIDVGGKNLNMKISERSIQMCGSKSEDQARTGARLVIDHISHIQEEFEYMKKSNLTQSTIKWFLAKIADRTPVVMLSKKEPKMQHRVIKYEAPVEFPKDIDLRVVSFLEKYYSEYSYVETFGQYIENALTFGNICSDNLGMDKITTTMINYNYSLGFSVDLLKLATLVRHYDGWLSDYRNEISHFAKIEVPCEVEHDPTIKKRKKPTRHNLMVYRGGSVTQSGPNPNMAKELYNRLKEIISQIKDDIIINEPPSTTLPGEGEGESSSVAPEEEYEDESIES